MGTDGKIGFVKGTQRAIDRYIELGGTVTGAECHLENSPLIVTLAELEKFFKRLGGWLVADNPAFIADMQAEEITELPNICAHINNKINVIQLEQLAKMLCCFKIPKSPYWHHCEANFACGLIYQTIHFIHGSPIFLAIWSSSVIPAFLVSVKKIGWQSIRIIAAAPALLMSDINPHPTLFYF